MRLGKRLILNMLTGTGVLIFILLFLVYHFLMQSYMKLEEKQAGEEMENVLVSLDHEMTLMSDNMLNYSVWDETSQYMQTKGSGPSQKDSYIQSNYDNSTFTANRLHFLLLFNSEGRLIYSQGFDWEKNVAAPVPAGLITLVQEHNKELLHFTDPHDKKKGILLLQQGPVMIVSQPIVSNDYIGPIRGTLLAGRLLDDREIQWLQKENSFSLRLVQGEEAQIPSYVIPKTNSSSLSASLWVIPVNDKRIRAYAAVKDIFGQPAFVLCLEKERAFLAEGQRTTYVFSLFFMFALILIVLMAVLFYRTYIWKRMDRLIVSMQRIGEDKNFSARLPLSGDDEIGDLERAFNGLMQSLEESQEIIRWQAYRDPLTQLPNRRYFNERLAQAIKAAEREGKKLAVMFIDLDRFKWINDTFGHDIGDEVLRITALRICQKVAPEDVVSRLGGDEFTVLMMNIAGEEEALESAREMMHALQQPIELCGQCLISGASVGISLYPRDGDTPEALVKKADQRMFRDKESKR